MHYFRTLPEQWPHRLGLLAAMGANCVETYVPWNLHERRRGHHDFTGIADLERFLTNAADAGLAAIVRPGPYICAEWENGGLPAWLRAADATAPLRCEDPDYLAAVDAWFAVLLPRIARHQVDRGGNVIAVQIENEYGSYGSDEGYLRHLTGVTRAHDITVPLFTSDGPEPSMLTGGTIDGVMATVNFGSQPAEAFAALERRRPDDHPWCMEYWNGWFDHWGEPHHVRDAADAASTLDEMLSSGASVNIYMAVGGTNFGCWSGANHDGTYQPTVTSYDYDAPISEHGAPTEKYHRYRDVIARHLPVVSELPEPTPVLPASTVELGESVALADWAATLTPSTGPMPSSFEELGVDNGLVWYRHRLRGPREARPLTVDGLADRALVMLDGRPIATLERDGVTAVDIGVDGPEATLDIVVESMGRVNYGPLLGERKGVAAVRHRLQTLHGWECTPLPLDDIAGVPWGSTSAAAGPRFHRGVFDVDAVGDAFVALPGWTKGYVWVNGFCLGRYWDRGPQSTLYLPWPLLRRGANDIVVLELDGTTSTSIDIRPTPELGPTSAAPAI